MTADQKHLLLPQIYFVNPSLGKPEEGTVSSQGPGRLKSPGPLIWEVLSNGFRQTRGDCLPGERAAHPN